jgi:hypothetical protein
MSYSKEFWNGGKIGYNITIYFVTIIFRSSTPQTIA